MFVTLDNGDQVSSSNVFKKGETIYLQTVNLRGFAIDDDNKISIDGNVVITDTEGNKSLRQDNLF